LGGVSLAMAGQASTHIVFYKWFGDGGLGHITMARGAINLGLDMRRVSELHQRLGVESIDPLPGNLTLAFCVLYNLLHARLIGSELGMTEHALLDRRNGGGRALVRAGMAIETCHPHAYVLFV